MFFRNLRAGRWFVAALALMLFYASLILLSSAESEKRSLAKFSAASFHDDEEGKKKGLSREERIREAWVWHQANRQRLLETQGLARCGEGDTRLLHQGADSTPTTEPS